MRRMLIAAAAAVAVMAPAASVRAGSERAIVLFAVSRETADPNVCHYLMEVVSNSVGIDRVDVRATIDGQSSSDQVVDPVKGLTYTRFEGDAPPGTSVTFVADGIAVNEKVLTERLVDSDTVTATLTCA